ncbi:MAG: YhcH/YjgK/YiaL family protein [Chthoniobacteraceae bacterium]
MIIDSLANAADYASLSPLFAKGFEYLRNFDPATPDGKYEIDGGQVYAAVQRYTTAPEDQKAWEAHRVYADIQYIVSGREKILYAPVTELQSAVSVPYNDVKDVEKYADCVKNAVSTVIAAGSFGIYLPQDGHKPGCFVDGPEPVVKVVIKVRVR